MVFLRAALGALLLMLAGIGVSGMTPAAAQSLAYVRAGIGVTNGDQLSAFGANPADLFKGNTGTSALYEAGIGLGLPTPIFGVRTEFDVAYRPDFKLQGNGLVNGRLTPTTGVLDITQYTGMANVFLDAPQVWLLRPFIGAGVGAAHNEVGGSNTDFAWNVMAGFSFKILPMTDIDITLRHLDAGSVAGALHLGSTPSGSLSLRSEIKTNEGVIGVRFGF